MGHWIRTETLNRTHLLIVDLDDFLDVWIFSPTCFNICLNISQTIPDCPRKYLKTVRKTYRCISKYQKRTEHIQKTQPPETTHKSCDQLLFWAIRIFSFCLGSELQILGKFANCVENMYLLFSVFMWFWGSVSGTSCYSRQTSPVVARGNRLIGNRLI